MADFQSTIYGNVMLQGGKFDTIGLFNINDVLHDTHGIVKDISFIDNDNKQLSVSVKSIYNITDGDLYILASLVGVDLNEDGDVIDPEDTKPMFMFRYDRLTKTARMVGDKTLKSTSPFHLVFTTADGSTDYWFRFNATHFMLFNLNTLAAETFATDTYVSEKIAAGSHPHTLITNCMGITEKNTTTTITAEAKKINTYLLEGVMPNIMNAYRFNKDDIINLRIPISATMIACITITHGSPFKLKMGILDISQGFTDTPLSTRLIDSTVLRSRSTDHDDIVIVSSFPTGKAVTAYSTYATITQLPTNQTLIATTSLKVTDTLKVNTKDQSRLLFIRKTDPSASTSTLYLGIVCNIKNSEEWSSKYFIDESRSFGRLDQTKGALKLDAQDGFETVIIFATDIGIHRINYDYGFLYSRIDEIEADDPSVTKKVLPNAPNIRLFGVSSSADKLEAYTNDPVRRVFIAKYRNAYATYHYDTDKFFVYPSTPLEDSYRADQYNALTGVLNVGDKAKALYDECFIDADIQNAGYMYLVNRVIALENNAKALEARVKALETAKESSA